jgi:hypothetical protein
MLDRDLREAQLGRREPINALESNRLIDPLMGLPTK